jgi:hypothetical protein
MKPLTKAERKSVFDKYGGKCAYCGCPLPARWHADHLLPVERELTYVRGVGLVQSGNALRPENHRIENMNPACPPCNISKHTLSLDAWRKWLEGHVRALNAHNTPYRLAKAYGLIQETGKPVIFHFETLSQGPMQAAPQPVHTAGASPAIHHEPVCDGLNGQARNPESSVSNGQKVENPQGFQDGAPCSREQLRQVGTPRNSMTAAAAAATALRLGGSA